MLNHIYHHYVHIKILYYYNIIMINIIQIVLYIYDHKIQYIHDPKLIDQYKKVFIYFYGLYNTQYHKHRVMHFNFTFYKKVY